MDEDNLRISPNRYGEEINEEVGEYLDEIHREVSRTFDAALSKVSGDLSREIQVGYLMCRIPDTIEDTQYLSGRQKHDLLNEYREVLEDPNERKTAEFVRNALESIDRDERNLENSPDYWGLIKNTHAVMSSFQTFDEKVQNSMVDAVDEMSRGMADFCLDYDREELDGIRIEDMDEFQDYCHFVAGTVGEMLTDIFSYHEDMPDDLSNYSESFGQFLQTINILKDPLEDLENESAIFIPEEVLPGKHEDVIEELRNGKPETILEGMESLIEYADTQAQGASKYIALTPQDSEIRSYLEVPYLLAKATAREAKDNPEKAAEGELSIDREEVGAILEMTGDNQLESIESEIAQRPLKSG